MPVIYQDDSNLPKAAEVRPSETLPSRGLLLPDGSNPKIDFEKVVFNSSLRSEHTTTVKQSLEEVSGISNRLEGGKYRLVYVNGIRTSSKDAECATRLVNRSLGINDSEVSLLYNPCEDVCTSGIKVLGAVASSKFGKKAEPECVYALKEIIHETVDDPKTRLIIVGHSQGSLIIHNTLDDIYDDFTKARKAEQQWLRESSRIEIILYAPLVRTIVPGPEAIGLSNCCDLPARSIGGLSRVVSNSKHYLGWRQQQAVHNIIYNPELNKFPDILLKPEEVHSSFNLILDDVKFNLELYAQNPKTKKADPITLAANLAEGIRVGRRSDFIHHEIIIQACDKFGTDFACNFLNSLSISDNGQVARLNNFELSGLRLERLLRAAKADRIIIK